MDSAVLVIAYRRPWLVERQLEGLSEARPPRLLVACDLPPSGSHSDADAIQAKFRAGVTWPCDLTFDVASVHLGLDRRVTSAIDAAFHGADTAIILEDDCVPHPDFLTLAECLLDRHRSNSRVRMVAGGRPRTAPRWGDASYYFSRYPFIWGWATWADRWREASFTNRQWTATDARLLKEYFGGVEYDYWHRMVSKSVAGRGTWDYQWFLAMLESDGLCAVPNVNLVQNVGFGDGATHTIDPDDYPARSIPVAGLDHPIAHPKVTESHEAADAQAFREVFLRA